MIAVALLATTTLFGMSLSQLNSASKSELMEINGIGDVKADAIIKERRKGKFKSFEDVQRVEGIGEQTASNIQHNVKSSADVKKVTKSTKKRATSHKKDAKETVSKKKTAAKKDIEERSAKKSKGKKTKEKAEKKSKRKIKSMDDKQKELKTKAKKTKAKKTKTKRTKAKKTKKTKSKKKN